MPHQFEWIHNANLILCINASTAQSFTGKSPVCYIEYSNNPLQSHVFYRLAEKCTNECSSLTVKQQWMRLSHYLLLTTPSRINGSNYTCKFRKGNAHILLFWYWLNELSVQKCRPIEETIFQNHTWTQTDTSHRLWCKPLACNLHATSFSYGSKGAFMSTNCTDCVLHKKALHTKHTVKGICNALHSP